MTEQETSQTTVTQIALIQLTLQQMQKDFANMASDVKEIRTSRFVTQTEMRQAITDAVSSVAHEIGAIRKILWLIFSTFAVIIAGAIAKTVLKI